MKNSIIFLCCSAVMFNVSNGLSCISTYKSSENNGSTGFQTDTLYNNNIQLNILTAFSNSMKDRNDRELIILEERLFKNIDSKNNPLQAYWYSFNCYYHSISLFTLNDLSGSERILKQGIEQLESIEYRNSEDYALLALMQCFSMQFASQNDFQTLAQNIQKNAEEAVQLDSTNLRAYYVLASNDFYTPIQYGGGKKAESYLKKALSLNDRYGNYPKMPSWGRNLCYEILIKLYLREDRKEEAQKIFKEAVAIFPTDYLIKNAGKELKTL